MKAKDKSKPPQISDTFKDNLKTKLNDIELKDYAKDLSHKFIEHVQLEADLKGVKAEYKAKLEVIEGQLNLLSHKVSTQHEWRDVDCHWAYDWETEKKILIREDSGETIREENITHADRQKLLPLEPEKKK